MRLLDIQTPSLKGTQARLEWRPLSVLFGANNAGKTNLLEAIGQSLGFPPGRTDPLIDWDMLGDPENWWALVELDESKPGDRALLCEGFQYGEIIWSIGLEVPNYRSARRRENMWDDSAKEGEESFGPLGLETLRDFLRSDVRGAFQAKHQGDWDDVAADVEAVAEAFAKSRHIVVRPGGSRLAASLQDPALTEAMERLIVRLDEFEGWLPYLGASIQKGGGYGGYRAFWSVEDEDAETMIGLPLWDVTVFSTELDRANVLNAVEAAVDEALRRGHWPESTISGYLVRRPVAAAERQRPEYSFAEAAASPEEVEELLRPRFRVDPWLRQGEHGATVNPSVTILCGEVSRVATELAPSFVKDDFEIELMPLDPGHWRPNNSRRVRLAIRERSTGRHHDLAVAGSGVALWASISLLEAIERLKRPPARHAAREDAIPAPETGDEDEYFVAHVEKMRVYLIDEPERHLHPIAQRQAAAWIADLAKLEGAPSVVVATHSPAFLNLPTRLAQYIAVRRDEQATCAQTLSPAQILQLDQLAGDFGVERSDLLQLLRRVLLVEGEHDKVVLEHFFEGELAEARTLIVPIRGVKNKSGIPESETLSALGVPVVIMFDDVHAAFVNETRAAETSEERHLASVRDLWQHRRPDQELRLVSYPLPDIFAALPESAVRIAVAARGGRFPEDGMEGTVARYRSAGTSNFKMFLARECKVSQKPEDVDSLLEDVLGVPADASPHPALREAVYQVISEPSTDQPG